jgi:hypothetical protein
MKRWRKSMRVALRRTAIATSIVASVALLSFSWSEQRGVSLGVESAQGADRSIVGVAGRDGGSFRGRGHHGKRPPVIVGGFVGVDGYAGGYGNGGGYGNEDASGNGDVKGSGDWHGISTGHNDWMDSKFRSFRSVRELE